MTPKSNSHAWKFHRIGGLDQVSIESAADLLNLEHLDQKLWVALSCPVKGLQISEKMLALIDADNDGRIRAPEVISAIKWSAKRLKDVGDILSGSDTLKLSALNDQTDEGAAALASARTVLHGLGKADATSLSLPEAADTVKLHAATVLNGDGIVICETAADPTLRSLIGEIISAVGAVTDRSGKPGIDTGKVAEFYDAAKAYVNWSETGTGAEVQPYGEGTAAAAAAIAAVRTKVDDHFTRARLAAFDSRAAAVLNRAEAEYVAFAAKDLTLSTPEIAALPIAAVEAGAKLPLLERVNPAWAGALAKLHATAVSAEFGSDKTALTEVEWALLKSKVTAFEAWQSAKAGVAVESLGADRLKSLLAGGERAEIESLIAADKALEAEFNAIAGVEQLIRYQKDFRTLLNNFVNFTDFYSPVRQATFQAGTLFLDSRSTTFCIEVSGPSPLAAMSKVYIAYCDCTRQGGKKMKIAACFTQGDSDYLFVGRNGIFYDRDGNDWDAKITAVAENPISVRQAFWLPYKKFVRSIEEMVAKRAAAAEAASDKRMGEAAKQTANVDTTAAAATAGGPKRIDVGTVAAMGVAATAGISALALILGYVFGLRAWQYPLVLVGIILVISFPSMLIAWLKLRQRTLGPILEANGWAINGRVKINVPFGTRLTSAAELPEAATRSLDDPYADKDAIRRRRIFWFALVVLVAAGIRLHSVYNEGRYFWQLAPEPVVEVAPATPAAP